MFWQLNLSKTHVDHSIDTSKPCFQFWQFLCSKRYLPLSLDNNLTNLDLAYTWQNGIVNEFLTWYFSSLCKDWLGPNDEFSSKYILVFNHRLMNFLSVHKTMLVIIGGICICWITELRKLLSYSNEYPSVFSTLIKYKYLVWKKLKEHIKFSIF